MARFRSHTTPHVVVPTYVDANGDVQVIPNTRTPPESEHVLHVVEGTTPFGNPWDSVEAIYADSRVVISPMLEDELLHGWIHYGQMNYGPVYPEGTISPENPGQPNLGPPNVQANQSSHTSAVVHNSSAEQGFGVDPAILIQRFPRSFGDNPYYAKLSGMRRNGQWEHAPTPTPLHRVTQGRWQAQWQEILRVSSMHGRLADVPATVPFSSNQTPVAGHAIGVSPPLPPATEGIYG